MFETPNPSEHYAAVYPEAHPGLARPPQTAPGLHERLDVCGQLLLECLKRTEDLVGPCLARPIDEAQAPVNNRLSQLDHVARQLEAHARQVLEQLARIQEQL